MRAYKTELDPNNVQKTMLRRNCGAAQFIYNWGLKRMNEEYEKTGKSPSAYDLMKEATKLLNVSVSEGGFPWARCLQRASLNIALINLDKAFKNFFRRCKNGAAKKGYPKFKSRFGSQSFSVNALSNNAVSNNAINLPKIGEIRLKERGYLPQNIKIQSATISEHAGRWFVSVLTKENKERPRGKEILGVDVGTHDLATLSDGTKFENPKFLKKAEKKLKRLQKSVSRKIKGSKNRKKAVILLQKHHHKIACLRKDTAHKCSTEIVRRARVLGIESLNVSGMLKNHCLAKSISDAGMATLLSLLDIKMKQSGGTVIKADRWFPSSKTCSSCGFVLDTLKLRDRDWVCPDCGVEHDRDVNAAINLKKIAENQLVTLDNRSNQG